MARATVNREHFTDKSRGSGFVIFKSVATAEAVLSSDHEHSLKGKVFSCQQCFSREEIKEKKKTSSKQRTLTSKGSYATSKTYSQNTLNESDDLDRSYNSQQKNSRK